MTRKHLALAAVTTVLVVLLVAGAFRVGPGEVRLAAQSSDPPKVYEAGWHWRLPFASQLTKVPREPLAWQGTLSPRTPEGATVSLTLAGSFALARGGEERYLTAAGQKPFFEAIASALTVSAERALAPLPTATLLTEPTRAALERELGQRLDELGIRASGLRLDIPIDGNPVLVAAARSNVSRLARPTGQKVLLIGWDGADWLSIRPLLDSGKLPNLARLIARGTSAELRSEQPLLSPLIWTTIATGKPVLEHGIADFLVQDTATGSLVPISSSSRKVHALWTILPNFGLRSDVVAWWASWPAEPTLGTIVSDRVAYQLFDMPTTESGDDGKVYPATAWPAIAKRLVNAGDVTAAELQRFVNLDRSEIDRLWGSLPPERRQEERVNHLRKILATTKTYHQVALDLLDRQADLTMLYYEGTDTVGHLFARYLPPAMSGVSAEDVARFGGALPEFYVYADELLGELLAKVGADTTVLLVSDHGFFTGEARPPSDPSDFGTGAPAWHRLYGVWVAAGPGVNKRSLDGATIFDVAPTVLALLGLPQPADMPGRALAGSPVEPMAVAAGSESVLASFETLPRERVTAAVRGTMDEERVRELIALGYVSADALGDRPTGEGPAGTVPANGGTTTPPTSSSPATSTAATSDGSGTQGMATEAYNRGRILQRQGDLTGAAAEYRTAIERLPSFGQGYASLAQVYALTGRHSEAFDTLALGFTKSSGVPVSGLTGLVDEARQCGRLGDAERVLVGLESRFASEAAYHAALGWVAEETGRREQAGRSYQRALALNPFDELAIERRVTLLRAEGQPQVARALIQDTLRAAEGQVAALNHLAIVALRQGWPADAETILRRILASDPGNPGVLANLAAALAQQRKLAEAITTLREAIRRDPSNGQNQFNLGAMLAETGDSDGALVAFRAAEKAGLRGPRVYVAIAKMAFRAGDREAARAALLQSIALDPNDRESRELLAILTEEP